MTRRPLGTFIEGGKAPTVIERVFQLIERYPSRSAAARAWGINVNTLKGYYTKFYSQGVNPVPRKHALRNIAQAEGVTVEWLLTGEGDEPLPKETIETLVRQIKKTPTTETKKTNHIKETDRNLSVLLDYLSDVEKERLIEALIRKGVEAALLVLDDDMVRLAQTRPMVKKAALMLNDLSDARVREILSEIESSEYAQSERVTKKTG